MKRFVRIICPLLLLAVTLTLTSCVTTKISDFFGNIFNKTEKENSGSQESEELVLEKSESSPESDSQKDDSQKSESQKAASETEKELSVKESSPSAADSKNQKKRNFWW